MPAYQINTSKVAHQTIDQETILIDFETGAYYSIEGTGSLIWEMIANGASSEQIIHLLKQLYQNQAEEIKENVNHFLETLVAESLIELKGASPLSESTDVSPLLPFSSEPPLFTIPSFKKYTDMQDLLLLDPIHEVDEEGWPIRQEKSKE